ncbi:hypothetical protein MJO28_006059 [Puccinia striiformis f. sp. tritici]|uniref:Uncharacterized protein n=1 Tax=Puccinia striiformis f. sp. tritici TaxID=168172 RepID=A0ACC0EI27_9BASI|nr:hypothetical protein Pst134EA_011286 [Puccinia striiformis f. sp. tritici]KAH9467650.1 hypothetical protein Pst134EA_011286 [Puccinia striiformis f. sp. tritici]KAI7953512.1 hypothetical protein MJO28_006059 [Puccinia striiformis f. sp. tritici]
MLPSRTIWLLFLASSIPILQVLAGTDQGLSPVRRQTLEKRWGVCMVPNRRKGCVVWGSQSCCRDCCSEYLQGIRPESWRIQCGCPPRHAPHTVVVVQQAAPPPPPAPAPAPAPAQGPTIVINHPGAQPAVAYPQPVVAYPAQPGVVYVH